jgi:CRISPR-associated protein Cas9/Csn1, subtype II/NMEMI
MAQATQPYTLGLDIGIASVGWSLLGERRILDLGVRTFDKAEGEKGASLNEERRLARTLRRRLRRRAYRLLKARRLFKHEGLFDGDEAVLFAMGEDARTPWELRAAGLGERLSPVEWARALYHILKHRGFHVVRRTEAKSDEGGKLIQGVQGTEKLREEGRFRTLGEMAARSASFAQNKRNKGGDYSHTFARAGLEEEIRLLFEHQRNWGSPHASPEFERAVLELLWAQKPALTGEAMLKLIGHCTFEKTEFRAAKRSYSAERFVWLTRLNNLRISLDGDYRSLTESERRTALDLPYKLGKVTYHQLRTALAKAHDFPESARFAGLSYRAGEKDPEEQKLIELAGWHGLCKAMEKAGLATEWQGIATRPELLDAIATVLTVEKTDDGIQKGLANLGLAGPVVEALLEVSFSDFIRLSLKALRNILPHMEAGLRYDEACVNAGYHHSQIEEKRLSLYLPPIPKDDIRNPMVFRALNQARKVVNAIIREYGSPMTVHIELARDLSRPWEERMKIRKGQEQFRDSKEKDLTAFRENFGRDPRGKDRELLKWRLYREQMGQCAYSQRGFDLKRLLEPGYAEIDHILPYSRSFDDSQNNVVLVFTEENRNKGNRTPHEYLDGEGISERWHRFEAWVKGNKAFRKAKVDRLLRKNFGAKEAEEFRERHLNDTRFICRFFKNFIEQHLALAAKSEAQRCVVVNGQLTAFLRARWGVVKNREASDLHHALDATVVAAASHALVKRLADYSRRGELAAMRDGFIDPETGEILSVENIRQLEADFPSPWPWFRQELVARLSPGPGEGVAGLPNYTPEESAVVCPIFVSRAPKRRGSGPAHKATIGSARKLGEGLVIERVQLKDLSLKDLDNLVGRHDPRNAALYGLIEERLKAHGGKGDKAFAEPLHKPLKDGAPGPLVRGVKVTKNRSSGVRVRGGIAENATMLRVDVFAKNGKHYLVPVYVADVARGRLPDRAVVAYKDEGEWDAIDDTYQFLFSMYSNDLIGVVLKKERHFGYFVSCNRSTGAINLLVHDRNQQVGKKGVIESIGVKTALSVEKFHVDPLGRYYKVREETRRDLA